MKPEQSKVVPLTHRHTLIQGDEMGNEEKRLKHGNTVIIIRPCTASKEEQEFAEHQFHLAFWDLCDANEEDEAV